MLSTIEGRCQDALQRGVRPDTGAPRPGRGRNTWGIASGRLLGSIEKTPVIGDEELAQGSVTVTPDRQAFALEHDVLTVEGQVWDALDQTIDEYLGETQ